MLLLLSLLILIHEAGHFLAARMVGIKVDKFGFGLPFGPTLFSKKIGDVEVLIHAFLLGGYVSFPDDDEESELPKDSPLRFTNKTVGQRSLVICAGVVCNAILAYVLVFLAGMIWQQLPANKYEVKVEKLVSSAKEIVVNSGLQAGDVFYSINGEKITFPSAPTKYITYSKEFDGSVKQEIVDEKINQLKELNPNLSDREIIVKGTVINIPEYKDEAPVSLNFDQIIELKEYGKDEAKLTEEQITLRNKINYQRTYTLQENTTLEDIAYAVSDTKKPLSIVVTRGDEQVQISTVYADKEGKLGFVQKFVEKYYPTKNIKDLCIATNKYVNYNLHYMFYSLEKLFTGQVPVQKLNGIVAITKIGAETIEHRGLFNGILLAAIISLNLALINLLPIPALDGGHLLFLIIEKVTGKPVNKVFVEKLSNFCFYLLILLMVVIIYNDIVAIVTGRI